MKIIDLINKIANGENVPKNIKWGIHIFKLCEGTYINYYETIEFNGGKRYKTLEDYLDYDYKSLNEEVEILEEEPRDINVCGSWLTKSEYDEYLKGEEEKKIPEKLKTYKDKNNTIFLDDLCYKYIPIHKDSLSFNEQVIVDKLNEILDYFKSKGE